MTPTLAEARRGLAQAFRAADLSTPDLDARLLLAHALGLDHAALLAQQQRHLTASEQSAIAALQLRRLAGEPVSRIVGHREFWSLDLVIDGAVLDPRPDTETLVEAALAAVTAPQRVADLGIGSGAILLALLSEWPMARGVGTDRSLPALAVARTNARRLGLSERVHLVACDYGAALAGGFDLVVSNPPYITAAEIGSLPREVRDHDPRAALDGGADGLDGYRRIAADAERLLAPEGWLALEIGIARDAAVTQLLRQAGLAVLPPRLDLAGIPRVLLARRGR